MAKLNGCEVVFSEGVCVVVEAPVVANYARLRWRRVLGRAVPPGLGQTVWDKAARLHCGPDGDGISNLQGDFRLRPDPYRLFSFLKSARPFTAETSIFGLKKTFLIQKMTKQDKETVDKRAK